MPRGGTNNFPESGRGLGHVTPTIFGIRSNISLKLLELETSNLIHGFVCRARAQINFPKSGRGLGHVTPTIFCSTVGYPSDSLASCLARESIQHMLSALCCRPSVRPSVCQSHGWISQNGWLSRAMKF